MKICSGVEFDLVVASHYGMCFGVKAAIKTAQELAAVTPVTVLGELAHNTTVKKDMANKGAKHSRLEDNSANTENVIITAHGASDKDRKRWADLGHRVTDTTCPLVHKAHAALRNLISNGYTPIVIGKPGHVEVRGLIGDFPDTQVVLNTHDVHKLKIASNKIGVISQTTQQIENVDAVMTSLRGKFSDAEVRFVDTVCRPTKERQVALLELCTKVRIVVIVGGINSNNTIQLVEKCRKLGCSAYHVQSPDDVLAEWFTDCDAVGLTAGTSTPDEDIERVKKRLVDISRR